MSRLSDLDVDQMSPAQRRVHDEIAAGPRGGVAGPLTVWLHSPDLADRAQKLGEFARFNSSLPPRLSELAILVTARHWRAQYEWFAHEPFALKAGLGPEVITAIRERRRPIFSARDEEAVYDLATSLHENHAVGEDTYRTAVERLGETMVVDLVGLLGYYVLVAMTLNTFEVAVPDGATRPLRD